VKFIPYSGKPPLVPIGSFISISFSDNVELISVKLIFEILKENREVVCI
jgi:hypothetical protein